MTISARKATKQRTLVFILMAKSRIKAREESRRGKLNGEDVF